MIEVYKIKKGFITSWEKPRNGKLEYWDSDLGKWRKTKVFEFVESMEYAESWFDVTEIYTKYGLEVAKKSANFLTAGILVNGYTSAYVDLMKKLENARIDKETIIKLFNCVPLDYGLALFGIGSFDVVRLDQEINTPKNISTYDFIKKTYGEKIAMGVRAGI